MEAPHLIAADMPSVLVHIVDTYGLEVACDPRRCRALVTDYLTTSFEQGRRTIDAIVAVAAEGGPRLLTQHEPGGENLASVVSARHGTDPATTSWAVDVWRMTLDAPRPSPPPGSPGALRLPPPESADVVSAEIAGAGPRVSSAPPGPISWDSGRSRHDSRPGPDSDEGLDDGWSRRKVALVAWIGVGVVLLGMVLGIFTLTGESDVDPTDVAAGLSEEQGSGADLPEASPDGTSAQGDAIPWEPGDGGDDTGSDVAPAGSPDTPQAAASEGTNAASSGPAAQGPAAGGGGGNQAQSQSRSGVPAVPAAAPVVGAAPIPDAVSRRTVLPACGTITGGQASEWDQADIAVVDCLYANLDRGTQAETLMTYADPEGRAVWFIIRTQNGHRLETFKSFWESAAGSMVWRVQNCQEVYRGAGNDFDRARISCDRDSAI